MSVAHTVYERARWTGAILPDGSTHPVLLETLEVESQAHKISANAKILRTQRMMVRDQYGIRRTRLAIRALRDPADDAT
jgi:hypothetical protein